jgi:lycopene elongase/hydratase (dihydrobisanhydrobacterioruberin-forming)
MTAPNSTLSLTKLFQLSRPRFWIYVFGPYLVGLAAGAVQLEDFRRWPILLFGLYFLFPANILIYGVNDIFDYETDSNNAKKIEYEILVTPEQRPALWRAIALTNGPFLLLLAQANRQAAAALLAFWFFSIFYSAPPIRAKTKPVVDSAFNILYIFPGVFGYLIIGGTRLAGILIVAAWCWAMAMHAYSAVPDITADRRSGMSTVATLLGFRGTLLFCLLLYGASAILAFPTLRAVAVALGVVYTGLMMYSLRTRSETELLRVYKWFPLVNTLAGAVLFFAVLGSNFPQMRG